MDKRTNIEEALIRHFRIVFRACTGKSLIIKTVDGRKLKRGITGVDIIPLQDLLELVDQHRPDTSNSIITRDKSTNISTLRNIFYYIAYNMCYGPITIGRMIDRSPSRVMAGMHTCKNLLRTGDHLTTYYYNLITKALQNDSRADHTDPYQKNHAQPAIHAAML